VALSETFRLRRSLFVECIWSAALVSSSLLDVTPCRQVSLNVERQCVIDRQRGSVHEDV